MKFSREYHCLASLINLPKIKALSSTALFSVFPTQQSDGEKSDQDLVVDDASEDGRNVNSPTANGTVSPRENGMDKLGPSVSMGGSVKKEAPPPSPRSGTSSNASTPSAKKMDEREKPTTPISKSVTPTSAGRCRFAFENRKPISS